MALKDNWIDRQNGIDDVDSEDINKVARAVIELEENANKNVVDQTYSPTSKNAQSGKAVAEAVATKADKTEVDKLNDDLANKVPKVDYAPEKKTDAMTQPVGKDVTGKLWTAPSSSISVTGATVGQTVKISDVDDDGVPTAWESVDFPSGVGTYKHIETITIPDDEEIAEITFTIPAKTRKLYVLGQTNTSYTFDTVVRTYVKNGDIALAVYNINLSMSHRMALFGAELYDAIQFMSFSSSNSVFAVSYPGAVSFKDYASYFYAENNTFNILIHKTSSNQYFVPGCTFALYALCEE